MIVFPVWHVGHQNEAGPNGETVHVDEGGVYLGEQDGDDVKLLGIYSSEEKAQERVARARLLLGFQEEPECFMVVPYTLDDDAWGEGFVRVP